VALSSHAASSEHALICWDGEEWSLRDLKSRNGTWINDTPLTGRTWRLIPGDRITFGDPSECWVWVEGDVPRAAAVSGDGQRIEATDHLLCLPDADEPSGLIYRSGAGWQLEREGQISSVRDQEVVQVAGTSFRLELPELDASSNRTRTLAAKRDIRVARALFCVSSDEEHVELTLEAASYSRQLPVHAFHYMLLVLARARIADARAGVRDEDAGWVYVDELTSQLVTDATKLNVDVCRARKLVDELGWFSNPEELIQRRKPSKQVRIGCSNLEEQGARAMVVARRKR
jgi:hypothetical protein